MKGDLPDVNVLLAFLDSGHESHGAAAIWLRTSLLLNMTVHIPHEVAVA